MITSHRNMRTSGLALAALLTALPSVVRAADAEAELTYSEKSFSFVNWGLPIASQPKPFASEPPLGTDKVSRGKFETGGTNSVAFVWNRTAGKLYVDLNGDLNLTNDADGTYTSPSGMRGSYQSFANVRLPVKTTTGTQQTVGDINLSIYGSNPNGSFALRSLWNGKLSLQGQEWEVGVMEDNFRRGGTTAVGQMLLRPWAKRDKPFSSFDGSLQTVPFSSKLFLSGHAYRVAVTNTPAGGSRRLQLTEEHPTLGEAKITGKFIQRLTLAGGPYQVVLDQPEGVVRLPVGSYSEAKVRLQAGELGAYESADQARNDRKITISEKTPAVLEMGGPLTNSVSVTRRGSSLNLSYQLVGAGGRTYTSSSVDRTKPPEFVAFSGGRNVGSGKFEFG